MTEANKTLTTIEKTIKDEKEAKVLAEETKRQQEIMEGIVLGIGLPLSWAYCHTDFFDSFLFMKNLQGSHVIRANSGPIHEMRNSIVMKALELGCTHLLQVDGDMVLPENTIPQLAGHKVPIVGALCFKRWPPYTPLLFKGDPDNMEVILDYPEGLVEVTATGTGCLMIDTQVFAEMDHPWFEFKQDEHGNTVGEDIGFCHRAKAEGYPIFVDTTVKTGHITNVTINEAFFQLTRKLSEHNQATFMF